jgi:acetate kinase
MGGVDAIVFTGGIGSNSPLVRARSLEGLDFLGVSIDTDANAGSLGCDADLSSGDSRVRVFTILTDEELVIASDTMRIVSSFKQQRG